MKKILIATYGLYSGGVETSLLSLLNTIKDKYEITLLLLKKEGIHLNDVPTNIKIIELPFKKDYYNIFKNVNDVSGLLSKMLLFYFKLKNKVFTLFKKRKNANSYFLKYTKSIDENFDIAIDYHGYGYFGTGYIAEIINAERKYTWIHSSNLEWVNDTIQFFEKFNIIFAVSNYAKEEFLKKFPEYTNKLDVFYNLMDYSNMYQKADEFIPILDEGANNILTIGRLEKEKGYDLLLDIAKILNENKIKFKWYIIGKGSLYNHLKNRITDECIYNVELLGEQRNPYPYFKTTDIYVQTSNFEGYGLTIAEAKAFCKPIICSDIPTFKEQIEDGITGFVCKQTSSAFANKITEIINDSEIKEKFIKNLNKQNKYSQIIDLDKFEKKK